jgi:peptidoglycan/xylan/chitin deacetylase (PgdA/CDA1 family)
MSIDRRSALRAAAAVALGVASTAACDSAPKKAPNAAPASSAVPPASPSPGVGVSSAPADSTADLTHGPRDKPKVALTFHGQGDAAQVRKLLDELERGGAKVTVLAVGSWLAAEPTIAKRILDGGHELGNHTQNHLDIAHMQTAQALAEIETCANRLKTLTGSIGTWFRPSQTQSSTPLIRQQAAKVGYSRCLSYDLDSLDYKDPGAPAVVHNTLAAVQNGSIVSLHFGHAGTVTAMPEILDGLRQRGLSAVTMTELVN